MIEGENNELGKLTELDEETMNIALGKDLRISFGFRFSLNRSQCQEIL